MPYYQQHLFFCLNQRDNGCKCCQDADASAMRIYAKKRIAALGLAGEGGIRVNAAGCLGRCQQGPSLVIYPDGVWYNYKTCADIDEIIEKHIINKQLVKHLLMPEKAE